MRDQKVFEYEYTITLEHFNNFKCFSHDNKNYIVLKSNIKKMFDTSEIKLSVGGVTQKNEYNIIDFDEYKQILENSSLTDQSIEKTSNYMKKLYSIKVFTNIKNLDSKIKMVS